MSNHSVDCKHCGCDQRSFGLDCCPESTRERRLAAQLRRNAERMALFNQFFIRWHMEGGEVTPDVSSFDAFLMKLRLLLSP
jgi:hypothetical protein